MQDLFPTVTHGDERGCDDSSGESVPEDLDFHVGRKDYEPWVRKMIVLTIDFQAKRLGNMEGKKAGVACDIIVSYVSCSSGLPRYKKESRTFSVR